MIKKHRKNNFFIVVPYFAIIFFVSIWNTADANTDSSVDINTVELSNVECLLNWAQTFHPNLFSPLVSGVQSSPPFTYRFYPVTNSYLGVSSDDNHVYYLGPDGISPKDIGELSTFLNESGCGQTTHPVIFIHGLDSSADTWVSYRNYLINNAGWLFGGIPTYDPETKTVNINCPSDLDFPNACSGGAGNFYTLNFSNNQDLTLDVLGGELADIVKAVLANNPGTTKVILIGHSSGGLAARGYLQGLARVLDSTSTIPYREDVAKLITVGTPHQGSFWAQACHANLDLFDIINNVGICDLLPGDIDSDSIAVQELQPDSAAINTLNDLINHPLPISVLYVSIIGTGQPTLTSIVDFQDGDGIVSASSQDLINLSGTSALQQKSTKIVIPFRECANEIEIPIIDNVGQTHTCETTDITIGAEILRNLQ